MITADAIEGDESRQVRPSGSRIAPSCKVRRTEASCLVADAVDGRILEGVRSRKPLAAVEDGDAVSEVIGVDDASRSGPYKSAGELVF